MPAELPGRGSASDGLTPITDSSLNRSPYPIVLKDKFQALNQSTRWLVVTLAFPLVCLNGWLILKILQYFQSLVTTLILAVLLAFLLNPLVQLLQRAGLKRGYAAGAVFALVTTLLVAIALGLLPVLTRELNDIIQAIPQWLESGNEQLNVLQTWLSRHTPVNVAQAIARLADEALAQLDNVADRVVTITLVTFNGVVQVALTLVLTFYLLLDAPRFVQQTLKKVPTDLGLRFKESLERNFQNYFIGQLTIVGITGVLITLTLMVFRVDFALLFGISAGLMAFIPFGDTLIYSLIAGVTALQDVWHGGQVITALVVVDFLIDQIMAPRLVGQLIGLRPFVVIVALVLGAKVAGFLGLIIAVPIASVLRDALDGFPPSSEDAMDSPDSARATQELEEITSLSRS